METLKFVSYNANLIIGESSTFLLNSIIDLHNYYVGAFRKMNKGKSNPIVWYGGMRLSANDVCGITNWKKDKALKYLKVLSSGILINGDTFKLIEEKANGYYSINYDALERFDTYCHNYKKNWYRCNNTIEGVTPIDILKTLARENYNLLERRFRDKQK